jgi:hypothetical protein
MPEAADEGSLPDIVCLMGTGRSGTTVLEVLLANNPGFFGIGEAVHIFKDGFIRNVQCSCGAAARDCGVWSAVRRRCGWTDAKDERHDALFRQYAWHSRFPVLALGLDSRASREEFREVNRCLFSTIQSLCHAMVVVDSSKYAGRALTLSRLFPERVRVICVTRSPAGLIKAFRKSDAGEQRSKSLFATCMYYFYVLACVRITSWGLGKRVLHLRYDDLAREPVAALDRIGRFLGRDLGNSMRKVSDHEWLEIGHIVTGNRIRLDGRIVFRPTSREERLDGPRERLVAWLMNAYRRALGL